MSSKEKKEEGEEARVWTCELPLRLKSWKRTASGEKRTNTKAYSAHKKTLRDYFGLNRCPFWGDAWICLELHVYLPDFASHGDWDNYGKVVSDALEGILFKNDRQVLDGRVIKHLDSGEERVVLMAGTTRLEDLDAPDIVAWGTRRGAAMHLEQAFELVRELRPTGVPIEMFTNHVKGDFVVLDIGGQGFGFHPDNCFEGAFGGNFMEFENLEGLKREARDAAERWRDRRSS